MKPTIHCLQILAKKSRQFPCNRHLAEGEGAKKIKEKRPQFK
jgi:hypothetical protein